MITEEAAQELADFYPRSHVGNDSKYACAELMGQEFLSTFPRRERPVAVLFLSPVATFLSTFPRRERPIDNEIKFELFAFLSTFPRRERLMQIPSSSLTCWTFLSTFPRRERPLSGAKSHILTVFLSTFPRRERPARDTTLENASNFYPRSHVGNDGRTMDEQVWLHDISIHVPT